MAVASLKNLQLETLDALLVLPYLSALVIIAFVSYKIIMRLIEVIEKQEERRDTEDQ